LHTRNEARDFLLVGVTGGIGSGKSLVCEAFARLGRTIISADRVAHEITDHDPAVRDEIRALLGTDVYRADGTLDRSMTAARVFGDRLMVQRLNRIVHPRVFAALHRTVDALPSAQRQPYVIIEAALIFESGFDRELDRVIVVDAPEEDRIRRVVARDGSSEEDVRRRIAAQMPSAKKTAKADFVILNEHNVVSIDEKVKFLDGVLRSLGLARPGARHSA